MSRLFNEIELKPFDVIVKKGEKLNFLSQLIMWRSLSQWSHSFLVKNTGGGIIDITLEGVHYSHIDHYKNSYLAVCRHKQLKEEDYEKLFNWCTTTLEKSKGYDILGLLGFILFRPSTEDEERWFCSEFVYNLFQLNGYKLTNKHSKYPYPCLFYKNTNFEIITEGVFGEDFFLKTS